MIYLDPRDYSRWSVCPGSPALAENDPPPKRNPHPPAQVDERVEQLKAQSAKSVQVLLSDRLDLSTITGERGAIVYADAVLIADSGTHSRLEVWHTEIALKGVPIYVDQPTDEIKILTLAALAKYSLLHEFTDTNAGTPAALDAFFAEEVRTHGALCLELRNNVAALSQLNPGEHCQGCPAAYRCPALTKDVHEEVFGEIQSVDDPHPTILEPRTRVSAPEDLPAYLDRLYAKLPLIEHWIRQVKAHRALLKGTTPKLPKVKRRRRKMKAKKPKPIKADSHADPA
jgi:hypothetical protein